MAQATSRVYKSSYGDVGGNGGKRCGVIAAKKRRPTNGTMTLKNERTAKTESDGGNDG